MFRMIYKAHGRNKQTYRYASYAMQQAPTSTAKWQEEIVPSPGR